jgi:hypothetical protein
MCACRSGGTGRRSRLKICRGNTRVGSIPSFGTIIGLVPWVVICMCFFNAAASATGTVPTFVYYILGTISVFFNCFAINMVLQYRKVGKWRDYIFGERVYVLLLLVAKSALAWQIFFGAVARN